MIIRELKPSQRVQGRWLVVLDDGSILRVGEGQVIDFALYVGKELTDKEGQALAAAARGAEIKGKAMALLARKPQSRWELERKLKEWQATPEQSTALCQRMEELGYLNDGVYAVQVVRHYCAKGFGEQKLRDELYRRGVPRTLWDQALDQAEDPARAIDEFLAKKLDGKQPDRKELQKVSAALARRGYSWSDIRDALARYGAGSEEFD